MDVRAGAASKSTSGTSRLAMPPVRERSAGLKRIAAAAPMRQTDFSDPPPMLLLLLLLLKPAYARTHRPRDPLN